MQRKIYIDNIKGFGILLVVFGHCLHHCSSLSSYQNNYLMDFIAIFYMKMFFLYSGIVCKFKEESFVSYTIKSFKALIWPCLFFFIVSLGLKDGFNLFMGLPLVDLDKGYLVDFYWFAKCLFACRVAAFCLFKFLKWINLICHNVSNLRVYFVLSVLCTVLLYALSPIVDVPWGFKTVFIYYAFGIMIGYFSLKITKGQQLGTRVLSFLFLVGLSVVRYTVGWENEVLNKITQVLIPIPALVVIEYIFHSFLDKEIKVLTLFGRNSLLVYLIHPVILETYFLISDYYISRDYYYNVVMLSIVVVVLSILSLTLARFIEENKVLKKIVLLK